LPQEERGVCCRRSDSENGGTGSRKGKFGNGSDCSLLPSLAFRGIGLGPSPVVLFVGLLGCSEFVCCFWWFSIGSGCGRVKEVGLLCWLWEVRACVVENATERGSLCPRKESS